MFRKFWVCSAHFGQNGGWDESCGAQIFLCGKPHNLLATSQLQRPISKIFTLGVIAPKIWNQKWVKQAPHYRLQVTGCTEERYYILHVVVQGPGSFRGRSTFLYDVRLRNYEVSKLPNFRILAYFPYTKLLKLTFRWPAYSPGVTSQNDFYVIVKGPKACFSAPEISCDFW